MKIAFKTDAAGVLFYDPVTGDPVVQRLDDNVVVLDVSDVPGRARPGFAWRFNGKVLVETPNHRGEIWYSKITGEKVLITVTGPVGDELTSTAPPEPSTGETLAWDDRKSAWKIVPEASDTRALRIAAEATVALSRERAGMTLTNTDLARALFRAKKITGEEAEAFASTGAVPESMLTSINDVMAKAGLSDAEQTEARILLRGLMVYHRTASLTPVIGAALDMDDADLDALFRDKVAQ